MLEYNPLISIVVPVYKVEDYLSECIESILAQDYHNIEIILVDDGSPDSCGVICDAYQAKDNRIKVIHKENGGLSDARNFGFRASKGDFVWFIDSDDYIDKNCLLRLVSLLSPELEVLLFNYRKVWPDKAVDMPKFKQSDHFLSGSEVVQNYGVIGIEAWTQIYNSNLLRSKNELFKKGILHEDVLFNTMLYAKLKRIRVIGDVVYNYRMRDGSIIASGVGLKSIQSYFIIIPVFNELAEKSALPTIYLREKLDYYWKILLRAMRLQNISKMDKKMIIRSLKEEKVFFTPKNNERFLVRYLKTKGINQFPNTTIYIIWPLYNFLVRLLGFFK